MLKCLCLRKKVKSEKQQNIPPDIIQNGTNNGNYYGQHQQVGPFNAPPGSSHPIQPIAPSSGGILPNNNLNERNVYPIQHPEELMVAHVRVRALYAYRCQHQDDLPFQKGDTMFVLSDLAADWWFARHSTTGKSGYIPSNYVVVDDGRPTSLDGWFDIGRREADRKLLMVGNPKGTYLIRSSSGNFLFLHSLLYTHCENIQLLYVHIYVLIY